jgi:hypothetical protein
MNGTDTPVNPEDLAPYTEFDGEYYYDGNDTGVDTGTLTDSVI